ncbi:MAG: GspE/PulE family protein [Nitrospiria bacterium]
MPQPQQKKKRLGQMLLAEGLVTELQLERALRAQKNSGSRLGKVLLDLGYVTEDGVIKVLGKQMGIPHISLGTMVIDPEVIQLIPELAARRHQVLPLFRKEKTLHLAMVDPLNVFAIDDIHQITGLDITPVVGTEREILKAIERFYRGTGTMKAAIQDADRKAMADVEALVQEQSERAEDSPVVKFVNTLIGQAVKEGASDVHLEPDGEIVQIRYRVDGLLHDVMTAPKSLQAGVVSRIKILASMDIAETRVPQDGRFEMKVGDKDIDIRISTLPTGFGEKIVMRLLDKVSVLIGLEELGWNTDTLRDFDRYFRRPYGLILVTGATGSGKTTTLYSVLQTINTPEKNIVTIEDPVEYQLKRITQVQVNEKVGVTFAKGLRSILRQDPDVVMVGEIRDRETVNLAIQAALTGHLVLSTLHTNDAPGAIARLIDMGAEPFLIASSLTAVVSQKLVRKICSRCTADYNPPEDLIDRLGLRHRLEAGREPSFQKGSGCPDCRGTGYAGRIGLYELLPVDGAVRDLIVTRSSSAQIRKAALKTNFQPLRSDGISKALQGQTSLEEVLRVTQEVEL